LTHSGRWPGAELRELALPADPLCRADPALLAQALTRLLEFVRGSAGSPAVVEIACRETKTGGQPGLTLKLSSSALNWSAAEEQTLFEPFAGRRGRGTGLELAVARRLVELHGGGLQARSTDAGQAELLLELPR
jgi:K+-sensing histidine kinase KdpD